MANSELVRRGSKPGRMRGFGRADYVDDDEQDEDCDEEVEHFGKSERRERTPGGGWIGGVGKARMARAWRYGVYTYKNVSDSSVLDFVRTDAGQSGPRDGRRRSTKEVRQDMARSNATVDDKKCAEAAQVCACFNFRKASRAVSKLFDDTLQPTGLRSTQFVTLVAIHLNQPVNLSALARDMVADRSTLTRNLNVLERSGLVRSKKGVGGRTRLYSLTEKGRRTIVEGLPLWERAQASFIEHMGKKNWSTMLGRLDDAVNAARQA